MKLIPAGIGALLVAVSTVYAADADPVRKEMLKELIKLNEHLTSLEKKIDKLSKRPVAQPGHRSRGADKVLLSKIKFPEKPTKENLKKYIREIQDACKGQNSFSSNDPQVAMLEKVGHKNIDLLIEAYTGSLNAGMQLQHGKMYLENAIAKLVGPDDKELVIKMLPKCDNMIKPVLDYGWEKDAKQILIDKVKYSQNVNFELIKAVASFRDPSTYGALREQFVKNYNPEMIYKHIKDLPIDFDSAVNDMWKSAKYSNNTWRMRNAASIALEHGNVDAFEYLLDYLQSPEVDQYSLAKMCFLVRKYSGKNGTIEEIGKWVKENRKQLYFDKKLKTFKVKAAK